MNCGLTVSVAVGAGSLSRAGGRAGVGTKLREVVLQLVGYCHHRFILLL